MSTIYLARHGQTEWSQGIPRYCGVSDPDLNATGKVQAQRLAQRLENTHLQVIYSSPLKRALLTAQTVGEHLGLPVEVDEGFREIHYGAWEGLTHAQIYSDFEDIRTRWDADPAAEKPPGGETGIEVAERALGSLRKILQKENHERFLIVSHKTVQRLILCGCLGIDLTDYRRRFSLGNTGLSALQYDAGNFILKLHNDKCHLAENSASRRKVEESV
jgi:probable phosphoglycerate mutase